MLAHQEHFQREAEVCQAPSETSDACVTLLFLPSRTFYWKAGVNSMLVGG